MITQLLFDLDNTLYSARYGLEEKVNQRLMEFLSRYLKRSPEEAARERAERIRFYGTTLEWLMAEKGLSDPEVYLRAIHPEDEADRLEEDPELRPFLEGLGLPMAILTNSPMEHAERILSKLKIGDLFTHVFDIRSNKFKGKPDPGVFRRALDILGSRPETTLFVDDYPKYLGGFLALGGRGVLIDEFDRFKDFEGPKVRRLKDITPFLLEAKAMGQEAAH
jgi:putative hydrolase of the HAD superfamily